MTTIKNFEELQIWQAARTLAADIYRVSQDSSFSKDYALRDQIRRSGISILSNIAEGFERDGKKEFVQFLSMAKGSSGELRSQLYIALDQNYITRDQFSQLNKAAQDTAKGISALMSYLKRAGVPGTKFRP